MVQKKKKFGLMIAVILVGIIVVIALLATLPSRAPRDADEGATEAAAVPAGKSYIAGMWNCAKGSGDIDNRNNREFFTAFELNDDGTFRYGKYGDLDNNHYAGTYTYIDEGRTGMGGDYRYYDVKFKTSEFVVDGTEQMDYVEKSELEMGVAEKGEGNVGGE